MDAPEHKYEKDESDGNELEVTDHHANSNESKVEVDHDSDARDLDRLGDRSEHSLEDDNWSQQVETDETAHMATSVVMEEMEDAHDHGASLADISSDHLPSPTTDRRLLSASNGLAPKRKEPTLKEKLVERERQRRVETERARLKRHFALSSNDVGGPNAESGEPDGSVIRENGSIAATIGEGSSVAFLDPNDEEGQRLTYPMERFLQDQGAIEEESARDMSRDGGVLMERFLMEQVVVDTPTTSHDANQHIDRSVSFELDPNIQALGTTAQMPQEESMIDRTPSDPVEDLELTQQISASADGVALPDQEHISFPAGSSIRHSFESDEPRVLRLTEAEIQEMAAIDEMSRSNAPPSDRGSISESSFVGELMSDFPNQQLDNLGSASQGTGTTDMESASVDHSQSGRTMSEHGEGPTINIPGTASVSSNAVSSTDASVAANPPSVIEGDEPLLSPIQSRIDTLGDSNVAEPVDLGDHSPLLPMDDPGPPDVLQEPGPAEMRIVNRQLRPGMVPPRNGTPIRRSVSAPDNMHFDVSGFDYDKDEGAPESPLVHQDVQANDMWSPGSNMSWSPIHRRSVQEVDTAASIPILPSYSDTSGENEGVNLNPRLSRNQMNQVRSTRPTTPRKVPPFPQVELDIFDKIRCNNDYNFQHADAKQYFEHGSVHRAFPERMVVLSITLLLEVPIVFMICGGRDKIIDSLGNSEYLLFVSMLPICLAISGNVGIQASELTVRAIAQGQVDRKSFTLWVLKEIGASAYLGLAMSSIIGTLCILIGGFKLRFASIIAAGQFFSILSASLTGSLTPLLAAKVFKEAGNSWNSALVTAVQDLVGSAVLVMMVYKLGGISESFGEDEAEL